MADESTKDPEKDTRTLVEEILAKHVVPDGGAPEPLLVRISELSPEQRGRISEYQVTDYIVPMEEFRVDDLKLSCPVSILWLLTNECQVRCQYCYMEKPPVPKDDLLPFARAKELLHEARGLGVMGIYISGGDPLCYPHLFEFLEVMEELEFPSITIPTKSYVSPESAKRFAQCKAVEQMQFSIDSTVPEVADFLVQSPGFCERTLESIKNVQAAGIESICVKAVITPYNVPTIPKFYRDMKALGVSEIITATYCKSGFRHQAKLFNHPDDYEWLDAELDKVRSEFPTENIAYQNGAPRLDPESQEQRAKSWPERARCTAGRDSMTVCANGKVVACEQMPENEEHFLGDLRTQSIPEVWNGKALDEYLIHPARERFAGTVCFDCDEFVECQTVYGLCVRNSCIHYGTRWHPTPNCPRLPAELFVREW